MKCDWIDDDTKLPSREELLDWLDENVVSHVLAPDSPVGKATKKRVEKSFIDLKEYAKKASENTAPRYIIDFYWNAIRGKTDVYDSLAIQKVITFEDVVEDFTKFCYSTKL